MRVFVAGATGAIGRSLLPQLIEAGHEVTGMTRSADKAAAISAAGAKPAVADVFDEDRVRSAMVEAAPEVVVHQLTSLPDRLDFRDSSIYDATNEVRSEGTRILIDCARAAGARRMVAQSIAFIYAPQGDWVKDEEAPVLDMARGAFGEACRTVVEMERAVVGAEGLEGLVLRYGFFYGPGTYYASDGTSAEDVRKRKQPLVGKATGTVSFIHVDDAAAATVAAVERGAAGIYNVVDDEPAPFREWMPVYAEALGAKKPFRVPVWLAKLVAGKPVALFTTELRGASNAKAKSELGWEPHYRSWRQGFKEALG
ncbi:MAG: NAD-dependent epimerase/dehydratase family protein [Thermoleophilaceae bacterium]